MPCTVYDSGHATPLDAVRTPALNNAADVITFIVDPGATCAVNAKSLSPAFATARILPVDGWIATIELFATVLAASGLTALRAAASARPSIVVARPGPARGATTTILVPGTGSPPPVWSSTARPGVPGRGCVCAWFCRSLAMVVSPASEYEVRSVLLASAAPVILGGTST